MAKKRIDIIGIGMGACDLLTQQARLRIEQAQVIIGAMRMVEFGKNIAGGQIEFIVEIAPEKIIEEIKGNKKENIVVLMSGDTGFYSGTTALKKKIEEIIKRENQKAQNEIEQNQKGQNQKEQNEIEQWDVHIIPGISSLSYFCSRLDISYENVKVLSVHGRQGNIVSYVRRNENTFILTQGNVGEICSRLLEYHFEDVQIAVGENLSYASERILRGKPQDFVDKSFSSTTVMLISNSAWNGRAETGIMDERFVRGNVPMTKSTIRSLILSKLSLGEEDIVYDIGAGTGSVSIEMSLLAWRGQVYAVECNLEGIDLIKKNQIKFQCDNIYTVEGMAPEVLEDLPAPDAVFIGGSKGNIVSILKAIQSKLEKNEIDRKKRRDGIDVKSCRLVMTAITLETLSDSLAVLEQFGLKQVEISQVSAAHIKLVGNYHMLQGENPVFMISGRMEI